MNLFPLLSTTRDHARPWFKWFGGKAADLTLAFFAGMIAAVFLGLAESWLT